MPKLAGMSTPSQVTLVQWQPGVDPTENLEAIREAAQQGADGGSSLIVFPEYSFSFAPDVPGSASAPETLEGDWISALTALAREVSATLVAGMLVKREGFRNPFNTMVAVGPGGLMATAEKLHLYDAFGANESSRVAPGVIAEPQLFSWSGLSAGMMACYDLRFPEVARRLVDAGAEVIIVPAQWAPGENKEHHWESLLVARAIENQVFVVAVGQPAPHGVGLSQVIDPEGKCTVRLGSEPGTGSVGLDSALASAVRESNPMPKARRFGVVPLG
jgi:predicted amidohydrolase